jgi:hypothetical protein
MGKLITPRYHASVLIVGGVLFATHPIHTEGTYVLQPQVGLMVKLILRPTHYCVAVSHIAGSPAVLSTLLTCMSLLVFTSACTSNGAGTNGMTTHTDTQTKTNERERERERDCEQ